MRQYVHFNPQTGAIKWKSASNNEHVHGEDGFDAADVAADSPVSWDDCDVNLHQVDLASVVVPMLDGPTTCRIVSRPADDVAAFREKNRRWEVWSHRNRELDGTDAMAMPDRDHAPEWLTYRQALRDLGKYETSAEWIEHWPSRPDGADPVADLRAQ